MADDAKEIARMEAHIANVAAVGPKWEKAVDKLRKQFPDDLHEVHKRVKSMVSESKSKAKGSNARSASVAVPASTSASSSKSSRKATKRPVTPPPVALRRHDKEIRDMMLTLPVKKKALEDLSDEMTKDSHPNPRASSSTITSFTSDKSKEDRFALPNNERISLDGMDMTQDWNLPENLQDIFAIIDTPTYEEEKQEKKHSLGSKDDSMPELKKQAFSTPVDNTVVNADVKACSEDKASLSTTEKTTEDAVMAEAESKAPSNHIVQVEGTSVVSPKAATLSTNNAPSEDTEMILDETKASVTSLANTTITTEDNNTAGKPDTSANSFQDDKHSETASVKDEMAEKIPVIIAAIESTKAEQAKAAQSQYDNIKDILLSNLQIDSRILAHLAKEGLTSTGYIMLRGIREGDIRYIIEAIAKAEGVGIVGTVLAVRRIEEAFHLFEQQVFSPKQ